MSSFVADVSACRTLDELLTALRSAPGPETETREEEQLWAQLPTFGGAEPRDTSGVWSWDATRLLVGAGRGDLAIVPRSRLSPGESTHVQFRCAQSVRLAVVSRGQAEGLTEREAWEAAGRAWADGG